MSPFFSRLCGAAACFLFSLIVLNASSQAAITDDLRTWTDKSGKFKIEAKFKTVENGKVVLENAKGERLEIDLDKLSPADKKFAEDSQKNADNPFQKAADNPFQKADPAKASARPEMNRSPGRAPRTRGNPPANAAPSGDAIPVSDIDWSGVKQLTVVASDWKAPAAGSAKITLDWQPRPLALPPKADFFENVTGILASPSAKKAVVLTALEKPGNKDNIQGRLFWCDLEKGKLLKEFRFSGKFFPLAFSADGNQLLARQDVFGFDNSDQVELWTLADSGLERLKRFRPLEHADSRGRDVVWAAFSHDGKTLYTQTSGGNLTWWSIPDLKPMLHLQAQGNASPCLSPDGKLLACCLNNEIVLLDADSGDVIASKPTDRQLLDAKLSFSSDNQKLACFYMNKLDVWNLSSGTLQESVNVQGFGLQAQCFWTSPNSVMAGMPLTYVDLAMQYPIWSYDGTDKVAPCGDCGIFVVHDHQRNAFVLIPSKLPHPAALQTAEQAKKNPNFFLLKPGVRVRVDVSGIQLPELQNAAAELLKKKLEANGNPVDDSATISLKANLAKGKDHEISYRTFGTLPFREGKKYTVPGWDYNLQLVSGDKTHWQTSGGTYPPPILHLSQDETVETYLKKYSTPKADFFKGIELPKYVAVAQSNTPGTSTSLRRSTVTPMGFR
jgi:hypothetical protein